MIYELHIGTFTPAGTFESAIARLDHLVHLGIIHVELMPLQEFSGNRGWGYDGVELYAPHHAYGGPDGLRHLVDACHARGLSVLLDVVYNRLGPAGITSVASVPTSPSGTSQPGARQSILTGPAATRSAAFFATTP